MTNFLIGVTKMELVTLQTSIEAWIDSLTDMYKKEQHKESKFNIKMDINTTENVKAKIDTLLLQDWVIKKRE